MKYGLGKDPETNEYLILDNAKHIIFARGADEELLKEFIDYQNGHLDKAESLQEQLTKEKEVNRDLWEKCRYPIQVRRERDRAVELLIECFNFVEKAPLHVEAKEKSDLMDKLIIYYRKTLNPEPPKGIFEAMGLPKVPDFPSTEPQPKETK